MRRHLVAFTLLIATASLACRQEEPPEVPDEPPAEEEPVSAAPRTPAPERVVLREPGVFPHSAHRLIECFNCHTTVRSHVTHGQVSCTECHTVPAQFASMRVLSDQECMDCHHGGQLGYSCSTCHASSDITGARSVARPLELPGLAAQPRSLSFDHAVHDQQRCEDCHTSAQRVDAVVDCTACHEDHHRADAACSQCHLPADTTVHREEAHRGCAGAGCHVDPTVLAFPPSRPICLSCHADQVDHEPQQPNCAQCHAITEWHATPAREVDP